MIDSSSGLSFHIIRFISHSIFITADLSKSHGFSSLSFNPSGKSNGFILWSEFKLTSRYVHQTVSTKGLYSFSGSITITSVHNIKLLRISSLTVKDFHEPDLAKTHIFAFSALNLSKIISELL
jgi:hypothetical protein